MVGFVEKPWLAEKAAEDIYFAKVNPRVNRVPAQTDARRKRFRPTERRSAVGRQPAYQVISRNIDLIVSVREKEPCQPCL